MSELNEHDKAYCHMVNQYLTMYQCGNRAVVSDIAECLPELVNIAKKNDRFNVILEHVTSIVEDLIDG